MVNKSLIFSPAQAVFANKSDIGGKAYNLAQLSQQGFAVPAWCVISTAAFVEHLKRAKVWQALSHLQEMQTLDLAFWQTQRQAIIDTPLAEDLRDELRQTLQSLSQQAQASLKTNTKVAATFFAVRSSVVGEDSANASFAGQMDSFLFQQSLDAIAESVRRCFASAFSERALQYRQHHQYLDQPIRAAVVLQVMIDADVSGVLFTANPSSGQRDETVISACYGIGEGIVSGVCSTDEWVVEMPSAAVKQQQIPHKNTQIVFDQHSGQGVIEQSIETAQQDKPCLSAEQLQALTHTGDQIAQHYACPQDIEWCWQNGNLFILQARPITSLPYPQTRKGKRIVWDNANIEESYCGVCLPLTLSFARHAYETVYQQTMRALGFSEQVVQQEQYAFSHMIGFIQGHAYYNINHWYQGLSYLPAMDMNKADMERMMGLQDPVDFVVDRHLSPWQKAKKLPSLALTFMRLMQRMMTLDQRVNAFHSHFKTVYHRIDRQHLQQLQLAELYDLTQRLRKDLLENWQVPIYNDFYVMMMNGKVHRYLKKAQCEEADALQNNLLAAEQGIESTEPTKRLLAISQRLQEHPELCQRLQKLPKKHWLSVLQQAHNELYQTCFDYIEDYGDRCIGEQKFETITVRQDSEFMFTIIENYLHQPDLRLDHLEQREQDLRQTAEKAAFQQIQAQLGKRALRKFKKSINNFRQAVKNRENMRMNRSRMFGLFRSIYVEMGRQFAFYGILDKPEDIFYLATYELDHYFNGVSIQNDFKALVESRRHEYATYKQAKPPHHFETCGMIYHHTHYEYQGDLNIDPHADQLQGIGCYPGTVTATVRLIHDPNEEKSLNGHILCTQRTDPGWAPLFPSCSGILVERGSTLSHSAVVARELGIPAVVGVPGLTQILKDGDTVTLDGAAGTVQIHPRQTEKNEQNHSTQEQLA